MLPLTESPETAEMHDMSGQIRCHTVTVSGGGSGALWSALGMTNLGRTEPPRADIDAGLTPQGGGGGGCLRDSHHPPSSHPLTLYSEPCRALRKPGPLFRTETNRRRNHQPWRPKEPRPRRRPPVPARTSSPRPSAGSCRWPRGPSTPTTTPTPMPPSRRPCTCRPPSGTPATRTSCCPGPTKT
jgi:hypothetical protein